MCKSMNVTLTAAESPFSNGPVEHCNLILSEMLGKTLEDHNTDFKLALALCVNTNNSLANVHSFSSLYVKIQSYSQYFIINHQHYHPQTQAKFSLIIFYYYRKLWFLTII